MVICSECMYPLVKLTKRNEPGEVMPCSVHGYNRHGVEMTNEGEIPINTADLNVEAVTMDESGIYTGSLRKAVLSPKPDRNGNLYFSIQLEVANGDYEGLQVSKNYIRVPIAAKSDSKRDRIQAQNHNQDSARFFKAFKIESVMPAVSLVDPSSFSRWQEWIEPFYDRQGKFTVENSEFPVGSGRRRSAVNDFIF